MTARTAYLAAEGFADELAEELGAVERVHGRLLIASGPPRPAAWAANVWLDPQEIAIASISDAAAKLRAIQRNWAVYAPVLHRRATLIQQQLPKVSAKPLVFGAAAASAPLGSWTLLDAGTVLAARALHEPVSQWRGAVCRGPFRAAEPRLSEIVGGADPDRPPAAARRGLPRSRQQPRRLELGVAADGRAGNQRRQGAARARGRTPTGDRASARQRLCPRPAGGRADRLAVLRCRLLSGAAAGAGRALARRRKLPPVCVHDQIPGRNRPRRRPAASPPFRVPSCGICSTTSTN